MMIVLLRSTTYGFGEFGFLNRSKINGFSPMCCRLHRFHTFFQVLNGGLELSLLRNHAHWDMFLHVNAWILANQSDRD